ncbi:oocyte zinc finger protein XlCOF7.1 isoform X2 [Xenopus laevis]|nr:oocyte zinc finger protein XlCOF7.1 isoform X2 [Xenopus laevis]
MPLPQSCTDCMLGGACRHHVTSPTVAPPPGSVIQKENAKKILELMSNIIQLLTGEGAIKYEDVSIYFSMEQWEILKGMKTGGVRKESKVGCEWDVGADVRNANKPDKTEAEEADSWGEGNPPNPDISPTDPQTLTNCISHGIKEESWEEEEHCEWNTDPPTEQIQGTDPPTDTVGSHLNISQSDNHSDIKGALYSWGEGNPPNPDISPTDPQTPTNCISHGIKGEAASLEVEWKVQPLTDQIQAAESKGPTCGKCPDANASVPRDVTQVMFYCNECHVCFICNKDLEIHQRSHKAEKPFRCSECGKCFANRSTLGAHHRIHTGEKPYVCPECGKCFRSRSHLFSHKNSHKSEKPFSCSECGKRFSSRSHLVSHQISHTEEKPFSCPVCEKCFKSKPQLTEHYRIHTGEKPFSCSTCGKSFTQRSHLIGHVRLHTGDKPFSCSDCGKSFGLQRDLNKHMKFHSGEKPFTCNECGKSFLLQGHLKRHFLIHTGEKPFSCSICDKRFGLQSNLNRHFRIHLQ